MISTIMGFRNAPIPPKHGANAAVVAPLVELVDDVYHVMEQQIEPENAIREVEEELEAAAAVLDVKLYEVKIARMSD